jgi:outer membrane immunogenic protein
MWKRIETAILLGTVLGLGLWSAPLAAAQDAPRMEVGVDYNYVRTNLPPGGCGCIALHGGDGWLAFRFTHSFAAVALIAVQHASNIGGEADFMLSSYLFGPRYSVRVTPHLAPFGQVLLGGTHAGGSLAPGGSSIAGSPNAFAMIAGAGLDIGVTRHLAIRPAEADYFMTRLENGLNDRQNNFRFSAGIVFRF